MAKFADYNALDRWKGHILDAIDEKESTTHEHEFINGKKVVVSNTVPTVNDENIITFYINDGTTEPGGNEPTYEEAPWEVSFTMMTYVQLYSTSTIQSSSPFTYSVASSQKGSSDSRRGGYYFSLNDTENGWDNNDPYSDKPFVFHIYDNDTGEELTELYPYDDNTDSYLEYVFGVYDTASSAAWFEPWDSSDIGTKTVRITVDHGNYHSEHTLVFNVTA